MTSKKQPFEAVVISGGGTKGLLALGVLHYYHEKGVYIPSKIKEYAGSSAGAIICLLLICGYTPMDIFNELYNMDNFFTLNDCHSVWNIFKHMGLMSVTGITNKVEELVKKKVGFVPTLGKLKEMTGKRLCVSGANVTKLSEDIYTPETHPNIGSVSAIMITCNIPLIFQRLKYNNCYVIDGGLVNNFPWEYISEGLNTLGVVIVMGNDTTFPDNEFIGYLYRSMILPINILTDLRCQNAPDNVFIIKTAWDGSSMLQFTMPSEIKMDMFLEGYNSADKEEEIEYMFIRDWDFRKAGFPEEETPSSPDEISSSHQEESPEDEEISVQEWNEQFQNVDFDNSEGTPSD